MSPLSKIGVYLLAVGVCAIVISPLAYDLIHWLIGFGWLTFLENFPFHRYFSRTLQVSAIILVIPLAWWLHIRSLRGLGLEKNPRKWSDLAVGLNAALIPLGLLAVVYFAFHIYQFRPEPEWSKIGRVALTALVVACLEEFFFRAVLLGLAVRSIGRTGGVILSAVLFAAVHFLRPARLPDSGPVTFMSGWEQMFSFVHGLPEVLLLMHGSVTLFVSGVILALVTLKTRSLFMAIGLHAGWVFGQQVVQVIGKYGVQPPNGTLPWVGPNLVSGAVPTGLIPLTAVVLGGVLAWAWLKKFRPGHAD